MGLPNFKDIIGKLSVFKNNLWLLASVIIALAAVLLFLPTQLMSSRLKASVQQESITKGANKIKRLADDPVARQQYQMEAARQKARAEDANQVAALAKQTTMRELLSYNIFPEPDPNAGFSAVVFQVFGDRYRAGIDRLIAAANARDCPTDAELSQALEESSSSRSRMRGGRYPMMDSARSLSRGGLYGPMMMGSIDRVIIDEMCEERAKSISVYVNPMELAGYEYWAEHTYQGKDEAIKDCWYHQLAYWVIEDIFETIAAANSGYDSALTAPVKRFLRISFSMGLKRPRAGGGVFRGFRGRRRQGQTEEADKPMYVLSASEGLTESCTGRYSGDDIHVIHFNAAFVVSAKAVLPFIDELCSAKEHQFRGYPSGQEPPQTFKHNQITVLESNSKCLSTGDATHRYYRYGQDNVVELDLICEYIFDAKGYETILPEPVKKTLAGEDEEES